MAVSGDRKICGEFFEIAHFLNLLRAPAMRTWWKRRAGDNIDWSEVVNKVAANAVPNHSIAGPFGAVTPDVLKRCLLAAWITDTAAAAARPRSQRLLKMKESAGSEIPLSNNSPAKGQRISMNGIRAVS